MLKSGQIKSHVKGATSMNLKEKAVSGEKIFGTMLRIQRSSAIAYAAKNAGLDFVMYDCEHSNYSMETLHDLFVTGNALGLGGFLRVPELQKSYISRSLDQGATGVMVPMLNNAEMAKKLVSWSKYTPLGDRGFTTCGAHSNYQEGKHLDVMAEGNARTLCIAQIESTEALENIDGIAVTDGLDALLIGPNDLSISLGIPGDLTNPIELDAIRSVMTACKRHRKLFGMHAGPSLLKMFYDDLDIVMMKTDVDFLTDGFRSIKNSFLQ